MKKREKRNEEEKKKKFRIKVGLVRKEEGRREKLRREVDKGKKWTKEEM